MKMLEYLDLSSREEKPPVFEAIITEVRAMGLFMECTDILQRGLIKRDGFPDGRWFFENNSDRFSDSRGQVLQAGTRLLVVVDEVDRVGMKVDFKVIQVVGGSAKKKVASQKSGSKRSTSKKAASKKGDRRNYRKKASGKKTASKKKSARKNTRRKK